MTALTALTARRIAAKVAIAGVGLLAVAGLSACRIDTGAALFVQDERVGEQRVDEIVESAPEQLSSGGSNPTIGDLRQYVVGGLTIIELAERVADKTGQPLPGPDYTLPAEQWQSDSQNAFVRLAAERETYLAYLLTSAAPAEPTEADVKELTDEVNASQPEPLAGLDIAIATALATDMGKVLLGQRNALEQLFVSYDVLVNPRYGTVGIPLSEKLTVVDPNGGGSAQITVLAPIPNSNA